MVGTPIRLTVRSLRVVGEREACARSLRRLGRVLGHSSGRAAGFILRSALALARLACMDAPGRRLRWPIIARQEIRINRQ